MLDISQTALIIISLCLVAVLTYTLTSRSHRRARQRQREEALRQKFARKEPRIIHEISERLTRRTRAQGRQEQYEASGSILVNEHASPPETPNKQPIAPIQQTSLKGPAIATTPAPTPTIPLQIPLSTKQEATVTKASPKANSTDAKSTPTFTTQVKRGGKNNKRAPQHQTTTPAYQFDADENLYEHISSYSAWLASQSERFTLEVTTENAEPIYVPILIDEEELQLRNGHWFDLFRPPDLNQLTTGQPEGQFYCPFSIDAVEELMVPARQIVDLAEREGSSRYQQVLQESALPDFIDFLHQLKTILKQANT